MLSLNRDDIVFANFPFEEDKNMTKPRPCLILAVDNEKQRFLAAKITTTQLKCSWAVRLRKGTEDMDSGSLRSESWVNLNRREWIPYSEYIFKIGSINNNILQYILHKITE